MTSVLRSGAQRLLAQAVEMEVTAFIAAHGDLEDDAGRRRVVRHGHHRERQVQTSIGPVAVRCPRVGQWLVDGHAFVFRSCCRLGIYLLR